MAYLTLARVIHVLAVVIWIGGVAMVTMVILPAVKKMSSKDDKIDTFEKIEGRFSLIAKIATLITAVTGFTMIYLLDAWGRYLELKYWWFHVMTLVWVLFTVVLFYLEPYVLNKLYFKYANKNPDKTFSFIQKAHWVLLLLSFLAIAGAVAGSHGWFFF
jgi:uncharacterized membrane protein